MEEKDKDLERDEGSGDELQEDEQGGESEDSAHKPFRFEEEGYWEPAPEREGEAEAGVEEKVPWLRTTLREIIELMGIEAYVEGEQREGEILLEIKGDGSGLIIGKHGQTLDALQYIMNKIAGKKYREQKEKVVLDTENYRGRRVEALENMALRMREKVKESRKSVTIGPLNPQDRRVIHITLSGDEEVQTESKGEGFYKKLVIAPKSRGGRG
jgi:spoIIIJ-associated protein